MHDMKDTIIKQQEKQLPVGKNSKPKTFVLLISAEVLMYFKPPEQKNVMAGKYAILFYQPATYGPASILTKYCLKVHFFR